MEHDRVVAGAEAQDLDDAGHCSHLEEILEPRLVDLRVALADDADDRPLEPGELLDEADAAGATHVDGNDARREDDAVPQRQDGQELDVRRPGITHLLAFLYRETTPGAADSYVGLGRLHGRPFLLRCRP